MHRPRLNLFFVACLQLGSAWAAVDANVADRAALDGVKGIGPTLSHAILEERRRKGAFRDWADLERRVTGIGERRALALSEAGLTVDGRGRADRSPAIRGKPGTLGRRND